MASKNDDFGMGMLSGIALVAFVIIGINSCFGSPRDAAHADLCATILAEASPIDSLAVFQKHEGCFEYVQREAP